MTIVQRADISGLTLVEPFQEQNTSEELGGRMKEGVEFSESFSTFFWKIETQENSKG